MTSQPRAGTPRACRVGLALLALASPAAAQTPIVIDAEIPAGTPRYFAVPFTVPEGIREIEVRHDDRSERNILDWGLADPARVRGWGGGNTEPAVVGVEAASRSYLAGAIPAGSWSVLIGQAKVPEQPARYHLEIVLRATPSVRPISRALTPSRASRSICRICRMVSSLLAGIRLPSIARGLMPEGLTQTKTPNSPKTGRRLIGTPAGFKSEWWPTSDRNGGRLQIGIPGRNESESARRASPLLRPGSDDP